MYDFKAEVRRYMSQSDERYTKTLNRIADLYQEIHNKIMEQNNLCSLVQMQKPSEQRKEDKWKANVEAELKALDKKITHIEECVNGKT